MKQHHRFDRDIGSYILALVGVFFAAAVRYKLGPILGKAIPVVLFTVPVVISALHGGFWPGLFCTLVEVDPARAS